MCKALFPYCPIMPEGRRAMKGSKRYARWNYCAYCAGKLLDPDHNPADRRYGFLLSVAGHREATWRNPASNGTEGPGRLHTRRMERPANIYRRFHEHGRPPSAHGDVLPELGAG